MKRPKTPLSATNLYPTLLKLDDPWKLNNHDLNHSRVCIRFVMSWEMAMTP